MFKRSLIVAITVLFSASYAAADVILGTPTADPNLQDCVAFGCAVQAQFIYDSSYFANPISITELQFYNSFEDPGDAFDPSTYTFKLATATHDYLTPDAVFANNVGADVHVFTTVAVGSGLIPSVFSFAGAPFLYNPALGDLLIEIDKTGTTGFTGFTDYNNDGFKASRVFDLGDGSGAAIDVNFAPVVKLIARDVTPVPEPMTLTLTGLGLAYFARQLKKKQSR